MANIRILGLDDDNHTPMFVGEDGTSYTTAKELIEMLAQPHQNTYEVKMFAIVDDLSGELTAFEDVVVDHMFDALEGIATIPDGMKIEQIFDLFWNSANREWW